MLHEIVSIFISVPMEKQENAIGKKCYLINVKFLLKELLVV